MYEHVAMAKVMVYTPNSIVGSIVSSMIDRATSRSVNKKKAAIFGYIYIPNVGMSYMSS
jgi:hypothetical protein